MNKQLIIFMGPPGSGKGSLSKKCTEIFQWKQLSTGDLCRRHIQEGSDIGRQIDFSIKSGKLISDELIVKMVEQWLLKQLSVYQGIIFDGFPRTVTQAKFLHGMLKRKLHQYQLNVIKLRVSDVEIVNRLKNRYICTETTCQTVYSYRQDSSLMPRIRGFCDRCSNKLVQRTDDNIDSIEHRLKTYYLFDKDLLQFYEIHGHAINEINGEQPIDRVFEEFKTLINDSF